MRSRLTRNLRGEGQPSYGLVFSSGMEEVALLVATRGYDLQRQIVCCFYLKPLNKYQLESVAQKKYALDTYDDSFDTALFASKRCALKKT